MIFVTLSLILNYFSLGQARMPKFNVLLLPRLTHVIDNRLNSKYLRYTVMAEWLTHLTKDLRNPVRVSLAPSFKLSTPGYVFGRFSYLL